jgi:hypothetical protein
MSKQLSISAAFATFAMAAFAVTSGPVVSYKNADEQTGAATHVTAPAIDRGIPALLGLIG